MESVARWSGATTSTVSSPTQAGALTLTAGGADRITVTNTFAAADLTIEKKVVNGAPGPYTFELVCTTEQGAVALAPRDAAFTLRDGGAKRVSVPLGARCAVRETHVAKADTVTYRDSDRREGGLRDGHVIAAPGSHVHVTNTFSGDVLPDAATGGPSDPSTAGLASTGGPSWWLLPIGVLLLGGGAVTIRSARRRGAA